MRIVGVHQSSELYGSDRSFLSAMEALVVQDERTIDALVILPEEGPLAELMEAAGIPVSYEPYGYLRRDVLKQPISFLVRTITTALRLRSRFVRSDVVYVNTLVCASALIACALLGSRIRRFVHVREIPGAQERWLFKLLIRIARADVIYNSRATMDALGMRGVVIYNGVSEPVSDIAESTESVELRLLMIGRINAWKGQDLLLRSLLACERAVSLRIVGSPISSQLGLLDDLHSLAARLPNNVTCEFIDFCDDPTDHFLWSSHVVVPSIKPEPFGRVAVEALSYGRPVIAARHGGLPEIVDEGVNGALFDPGSEPALLSVLVAASPPGSAAYHALSSNARRKFSTCFSLESYKAQIRSSLCY
ncbi:glycosyltransferase family 4 protein [Stenotrophomonas sp. TWI1151]|uniref:glycosyltransferase family 4 protein n=1 Tax=Stenotrophomonas sp. TWI1151 TaxID=3136798 RepID=UPI00320A1C82